MVVVRKHLGNAKLAHGGLRDAIRQAIALVGAGFVKSKAVEEGLVGLLDHRDERIGKNAFDMGDRGLSKRSEALRSIETQ